MRPLHHTTLSLLCYLFLFAYFQASACYVQQYVHYDIEASLNIGLNRLHVKQTLLYKNNSPDTLNVIYFHLYLNKYREHSLARPTLAFDQGALRLFEVMENGHDCRDYQVDETLMTLPLHHVLPPGYCVRLYFEYASVLPHAGDRYGYHDYHYDVGNWYVTPAVYDRKGWHLNQHLDGEFYQEWGDFNVTLHLPKGYLVGATGNLVNPETALQDTLPENRAWFLRYPEDTTKTAWRFQAIQVHDFAWVADPYYILIQSQWQGITLNILAIDVMAPLWRDVADWGIRALKYLHETFGAYPYDQLTIADSYIRSGGMEYPQLVMINHFIDPEYDQHEFRAIVIHEMAHNWFYGLLASNQTEEEWMDEGFTTYAEIKTIEHLFGKEKNYNLGDRGWYVNRFGFTNDIFRDHVLSYLSLAKYNLDKDMIDLHPDYMDDNGYILEYSKTGLVLLMLEYTLGDSLFKTAMRAYYRQWRFKHPYPEDFFTVMERASGRDLDWFFEQWLHTNRKLDYSIDGYVLTSKAESNTEYHYEVRLRRIKQIFMPLDFEITGESGKIYRYHIPLDQFANKENDRQVLPYWHFTRERYRVNVVLPEKIDYITLDSSLRLLDINRLNNRSGFLPEQTFYFMRMQSVAPPLDKYLWELWPQVLYNDVDKGMVGANLRGSYLNIDHKVDMTLWMKPYTRLIDFDLLYSTPFYPAGDLFWIHSRLFNLDGRQGGRFSLSRLFSSKSYGEVGIANHMLYNDDYLMCPWSYGTINTLFVEWQYGQLLSLYLRTSVFGSRFDFSQIFMEGLKTYGDYRSNWQLGLRLFAGYSEGSVPDQYLFNLAGDNSWGAFQQPFYRSRGSLPYPWKRSGHLYKRGGGNVRGTSFSSASVAINIAAVNIDLRLPAPWHSWAIPVIPAIDPYLFVDAGQVWDRRFPGIEDFRRSCGFGLNWLVWDWLDYFFKLRQVRFEIPVLVSHLQPDTFRWLIRFDFEE
jgi:lysozyme family protein